MHQTSKYQIAREKALERSKLIKTKGYQLMADLDKNRHEHYEVSIQSSILTSFSHQRHHHRRTCPMEARMTYWHETKTKKYYDLANRIAEASSLLKLAADGKSLRKFLTASELPKKIIERLFMTPNLIKLLKRLTDCAITALKCSRKIILSRSSFNFE